jgi:hypothetical protein
MSEALPLPLLPRIAVSPSSAAAASTCYSLRGSRSDQSAAQRSSEIQKQELRHTIFAALVKGEAKVDSRSASASAAVEAGSRSAAEAQ